MRHHRKKDSARKRDGVAARANADERSGDRRGHKDLQLCRQAFRTLSLALAGGCGDEVLAGLTVRAVLPAPDATRLLVCLEPAAGAAVGTLDVPDVLARLDRLRPKLRNEVASALVRKRAPELEFVVVPSGAESGKEVRR